MTACRAMIVVLPSVVWGSGEVGGQRAPDGIRAGDGGAEGGSAAGVGVGEDGGRDVAGGEQAVDGPFVPVEHAAVVVGDEPAAGAEGAGPDGDRVERPLGERGQVGVRLPRVAQVAVLRALPTVEHGVAT